MLSLNKSFISIFFIFNILFATPALSAYTRYYTTNAAAGSACSTDLADYPGFGCARTGQTTAATGKYELKSQYNLIGTYFWNTGGCPVDQYEYADNSCSTTPEPVPCESGINKTFSGSGGGLPQYICEGSCEYALNTVGLITSAGTWQGGYTSNGSSCEYTANFTDSEGEKDPICASAPSLEICSPSPQPDPNEDCVTLNGAEICTNTNPNCGSVNGVEVCIDGSNPQNCGYVNGKYVCLESPEAVNGEDAFNPQKTCVFLPSTGKVVCVSDELKENNTSDTVTNPDGSTTTTTYTTNNVANSGTTTTTSTTSADGNNTTTTTNKTGTGGDLEGTDEEKDEGSITPNCDSGAVCEGDPLLCAIAVTLNDEQCRNDETRDPTELETMDAAQVLYGGDEPSDLFGGDLVDLNGLDTTKYSFGNSCPADFSYQILGSTVIIATAPLCSIAELIGYFLLIATTLIAARIII